MVLRALALAGLLLVMVGAGIGIGLATVLSAAMAAGVLGLVLVVSTPAIVFLRGWLMRERAREERQAVQAGMPAQDLKWPAVTVIQVGAVVLSFLMVCMGSLWLDKYEAESEIKELKLQLEQEQMAREHRLPH